MGRILLVLVLVGSVLYMIGSTAGPPRDAKPTTVAAIRMPTIDKSEAMQSDRKKLIEKLIREGVFQKVEVPASFPEVWVRPAFYALDFDLKQKFVSVVYAYYFDGADITDTVRLLDSKTNKQVGNYAQAGGGLTMF